MKQIRLSDPNLLQQFKIISYKIKAYGDKKATLDAYMDNTYYIDIESNDFITEDKHSIEPSKEIYDYFSEILEYEYEIDDNDRHFYFDIILDTEKNEIIITGTRYYSESDGQGGTYTFDEMPIQGADMDIIKKKFKKYETIKMTYEGGGDSGWIDSEVLLDGKKKYKLNDNKKADKMLEDVAYELLSDLHGAWGNDDGGNGTIIFNLKKGVVDNNHNSYYESSENIDKIIKISLS
jgi:hypothetical protein